MTRKCVQCIFHNPNDAHCHHRAHFWQDESVNKAGEQCTGWARNCSAFEAQAKTNEKNHKCVFCDTLIPPTRLICMDCMTQNLNNTRGWEKLDKLKQTPVKEEVEETPSNHRRLECL